MTTSCLDPTQWIPRIPIPKKTEGVDDDGVAWG